MSERGIVLSLCDRTGVMVAPWLQAGWDCWIVDKQHQPGEHVKDGPWSGKLMVVGADVRDWGPTVEWVDPAIVFAFPPCTELAVSGARWWEGKARQHGLAHMIRSLQVVEACRRICEDSGAPWMIENPVGRLSTIWRRPDFMFDPYHFALYADDPAQEAYTKRTCLWVGGGFQLPRKRPTEPTLGSLFHRTPPSADRGDIRSVTPQGFARAVFEANAPVPAER